MRSRSWFGRATASSQATAAATAAPSATRPIASARRSRRASAAPITTASMASAGASATALTDSAAASSSPRPAPAHGEGRQDARTASTKAPLSRTTTTGSTSASRPYSSTRSEAARAAAASSATAAPSGSARPTASSSTASATGAIEIARPTARTAAAGRARAPPAPGPRPARACWLSPGSRSLAAAAADRRSRHEEDRTLRHGLDALLPQAAGDHDSEDLIRPFVYLCNFCVPHHALQGELLDVAVAAEELDRVGGHPHRGVAREALGAGREEGEVVVIAVGLGRGGVDERPGRLDLHGHVGEHELDALEIGDRVVELVAFLDVATGEVEGPLGDADGLR